MPDDRPADLRRAGFELLAASFVVLFQELALIRWLPVEVRVVAYFPNLILISAFLGLGVGALRAVPRPRMWLWPLALLAVVAAAWGLKGVAFTANEASEHLWLLYADLPPGAPVVEGVRLPIILFFVLSCLSFVPLGQFVGARLEVFRARSSALWGYALDLGGSLLGVVGFTAVSWAGLRPVFWFLPPLLLGIAAFRSSVRARVVSGVVSLVILSVVVLSTGPQRFSPYYAIEAIRGEGSVMVRTNGSVHQVAFDVVAAREGGGSRQMTAGGYRAPYERLNRPIRKALVLGAGTGNDVAILLSMGAQEIHAVEIDPVILEVGEEMHPNHPYSDPRVIVHNTDARSFLNESTDRFDVIAFGTLDSMTRLSALSNVRLDNFVYTREALAAARDHLTDDGGLVMYFMVGQVFIDEHLTALLANTFGRIPQIHRGEYSLFNTVYMAGPAFAAGNPAPADPDAWFLKEDLVKELSPSDDWPYLYLPDRGLNSFYLSMMVTLALIGLFAILAVSPEMRGALRRGQGVDLEMFLYGFAFLLIETKFVTAMNLLWGATWLTSAVVFGSILAVILAGTVLTELRAISWQAAGVGLVISLLAVYALPLQALLSTSPTVRLALSVLYVGAPVLFASLCFAARFKVRRQANLAFGWNLLGAVLGGLTEFFSMAIGLSALMLVAVVAYMGAFLIARRTSGGLPQPVADVVSGP